MSTHDNSFTKLPKQHKRRGTSWWGFESEAAARSIIKPRLSEQRRDTEDQASSSASLLSGPLQSIWRDASRPDFLETVGLLLVY